MTTMLKKARTFFDRNALLLKLLFVTSVVIFVIFEVAKIFRDVDWNRVGQGLADQSPIEIGLMLLGGMVAVLPMLGYDFAIVKFLPGKFTIPYIIRSGWTTNSFTNIAGFGGVLGATLRAHFYSQNATKKQVLYALSKVALFLVAGLPILCWLALGMIFIGQIGVQFANYWIWLAGGALYFPVLFTVTKLKSASFFEDLTLGIELRLIAGSLFEWLFAAGFFMMIGWVMHVSVNLAAIFPLYVIASVLGVISMVPGGLGSFDVFMMMGMSTLGIATDQAVVWCLFFRIFYYIVPFIIGLIFFAHSMGGRVNEYLDGLPQAAFQKIAHILVTCFMYFSGIFLLLEAAVPNYTFSNKFLLQLYPYTLFFLSQSSDIIFAVLLIILGRAIALKVKRAFWPALLLLVAGVANTIFWDSSSPVFIAFLVLVVIAVAFAKKELYREQLRYSINELIVDGSIFVMTLVVYLIVGVLNTPSFMRHHKTPAFFLFPGLKIWLSGLIALSIAALLGMILIRYLGAANDPFKRNNYSEKRIHKIIAQFGGNEVSQLAYLRDKNIYYYQVDGEDQLFFMYRRNANKLLIMGEPVGNQEYLRSAILDFMKAADRFGYSLVFYETNQEVASLLHDYGFDFIKIGEEGYVDLPGFSMAGKKRRPLRNLVNKFEREGYEFALLQPPFDAATMADLRSVSDEWLGQEVEKGFSLGFFDEEYLQRQPIAVVKNQYGRLVAFANIMPMEEGVLSIDLMRHRHDGVPSGVMDILFIKLFEYGQQNGYQRFDMGMAPLANVGNSEFSFLEEKIAHLIYEYGYRFYSFQGLRSFKNKYVTQWYPKYIAYRKKSSLVTTMIQLFAVVNVPVKKEKNTTGLPDLWQRWLPRFLRN